MSAAVKTATVYVIDDDAPVRTALVRLLRAYGLIGTSFASIADFLKSDIARQDACVVADILLDHEDGMMLPVLMAERGLRLPVIFLTAIDSEETRSRAMKSGAAAFFRKPVDDQALIDAIHWALEQTRASLPLPGEGRE